MKKVVALILCTVMLMSFCACGKSKEAQNVDDLILAIGEVSIDSASKIKTAEDAYEALSDKDKEKVENYSILESSKSELDKIKKEIAEESEFREAYTSLKDQITGMNTLCDSINSSIQIIWDNVGSEVFYAYLDTMLTLSSQDAEDAVRKDWYRDNQTFAMIQYAWEGKSLVNYHYDQDEITEIIDKSVDFSKSYESAEALNETLSDDVKAFRDKYSSKHQRETDNMNDWYLESSLYAEYALYPSGYLSTYKSQCDEYALNISRYSKIAESYE